MKYVSTRGMAGEVSSKQAIIKGLADDGGLFVPVEIPKIDIDSLLYEEDYKELAYEVMKLFLTDFTEDELKKCINNAYDDKFDEELIAPVVKVEDYYVLELFHGATSAFKDMALSILPHLLTTSVKSENMGEDIVILTATSGDTGKAALAGFANVKATKIIVFYPDGGVSEIQKKQMVTQAGDNVSVVAVKGNFDDTQTGVKNIFSNKQFGEEMLDKGYRLSSANSINIGRLVPQIVYYFHAYLQLVRASEIQFGQKVDFTVPTGNFGDILAGFYARQMGLPVGKLVVASNDNKVLVDFFRSGNYDKNRQFILTTSPSMDILVSSNLERLINFYYGDEKTSQAMKNLVEDGKYSLDLSTVFDDFDADFATVDEVKSTIASVYDATTYLVDPHTAVAINVSKKYRNSSNSQNKMVVLSTASPYKFPKSVLNAVKESLDDNLTVEELVEELRNIMRLPLPKGIANAIEDQEIHDMVIDKEEMKEVVGKLIY